MNNPDPTLVHLAESLASVVESGDASQLRDLLSGRTLPAMGGEEDPADILLRAVSLIKDSSDFPKRLAQLLASLISAEVSAVAAEGLSPKRRNFLLSAFYLAAELPAQANLFSSLKELLDSPWIVGEEEARLSRALLQALVYQQTDASLEEKWFSLITSGPDEHLTPALRNSLLTAWRGLLLVPPRHEDWQAGEIVDFNRIQGGLKALHAKLSLQHDEDFRKDESVFSLETCLDILQETFPRSPGFWMSNFQPYLAEWPPTLVAILRARWPLPQVDSDDQQTSPEVREKTTRLLEKTFADWVAVDSGMEVLRAAAHAVVADYENRQLEDSLHSITEAFKKFTLAHDAAVDAATAQLSHNFLHEMDMLRSWQDRMAQAHSALQRLDEIRRQQGEIEPLIQWTRKVG